MSPEQKLEIKLENPDLLVVAGSHLHGTSTPKSDDDYRGFIVPPFEYLAGLNNFKHRIIREPDIILYSIKRFFQLLILGDPVVYEILFAPKSNIIKHNNIGDMILRNRHLFACKRFYRRISGYAQSEWRKVTGTQLVPIKRTPHEDNVVEDIRQVFTPNKEEMDEIIHLLFLNHPREIRPARRKLGAKRKLQIEEYGYCTSSACHTIRLLGQVEELMNTGELTFPRPNAELLLSIKQGKLSLDEVTEIYNECVNAASRAESHTDLPKNAKTKHIRTMYHTIIAHTLTKDVNIDTYASDDRWGKL